MGFDKKVFRIQIKSEQYLSGRYAAASVTHIRDSKKGEKLLGFLHGGMFITGSGLNGELSRDLSVIKLLSSGKNSTCIISTIRAETATLDYYIPGELLQQGSTPPPLIGHSLTLIGKNRALLW